MARRKCLVCGRMIDIEKESYQEYKNRVVHPDCFRSLTKEINVTAKKKKAAKTETKTKDPHNSSGIAVGHWLGRFSSFG